MLGKVTPRLFSQVATNTLLEHSLIYTLMVFHSPLLGWSIHGGFPKRQEGVILEFYKLTLPLSYKKDIQSYST